MARSIRALAGESGSCVELAVDGVEPAEHQRQHVVEVVRDAAGELAERLHLLRLAQLLLEAPAFGHVAGADDDAPRFPSRLGTAVATASIVLPLCVRS